MRIRKIILLICMCLLMSGCWDKVEIDRKSFVSTIGIDVGKDIDNDKEIKQLKKDDPFAKFDLKKLNIIYAYPDISQLGPEKGGTADEKSINVEAYSMEDGISKATSKSSRNINFGHTKLLILSSEFMNHTEDVKEVVDYLQRQPSLNRMMKVILSKDRIEDLIKFKPDMEKNITSYITGLVENSDKNNTIITVTLNDLLKSLSENGNVVLPCVSLDRDTKELEMSEVGIIKHYKLEGYLSANQISNIELLKGKANNLKRVIYYNSHPVDFEVEGIERKAKIVDDNGEIVFNIDIVLEGELKGYYVNKNIFTEKIIDDIQNNLSESLEEETEKTFKIVQKEFGADLIDMKENIQKYHPVIWNKISEDWEKVYGNSNINVTVTTNIRRIGVIK